ncbi:hypothetical protein CDL15_Pgr025904 [Punica granatum]|uniref:MBD domain-containing protein n=1 Tax=Punica granatum TaxID=22663 RepID=A0A218WB87_PUNGR|nr:hypothetical protein CDL15_Pgr025904 [Punica granatum]PKI72378.1 hypothetical protein CRG98_007248 [Punica granatum]
MEQGRSSGRRTNNVDGKAKHRSANFDVSLLNIETLSKIWKKVPRRRFRSSVQYIIHDNTSPGYGWLLPGWLVEERHMESGRVYRYYYGPSGRSYRSRREVLRTWEQSGVIVIDK